MRVVIRKDKNDIEFNNNVEKFKGVLNCLNKKEVDKLMNFSFNNSNPPAFLREMDKVFINKLRENLYFKVLSQDDLKKQRRFIESNGIYFIEKRLGCGGSCDVYSVVNEYDKKFAIKVLRNEDRKESFIKEVSFLESLNHKNIVKILNYSFDDVYFYIMPKYDYTLNDVIEKMAKEKHDVNIPIKFYDFENYLSIIKSISDALLFMHEKGIYHTDLKESNILVKINDDGSLETVLSDFGCATDKIRNHFSKVGNKLFNPEHANDLPEKDVDKYDSYSFGVILNKLSTNKLKIGKKSENVSDKEKLLVFIDYLVELLMLQNKEERASIKKISEMIDFWVNLFYLKYFENFKIIEPFQNNFQFNIVLPYTKIIEDKKNKNALINLNYFKNNLKSKTYNFIEAEVDCSSPIKLSNPYLIESWIGNNTKYVNFYDFDLYFLSEKRLICSSELNFHFKEIVRRNLNNFNAQSDKEIFYDKKIKEKFFEAEEVYVFDSCYKETYKIKFLFCLKEKMEKINKNNVGFHCDIYFYINNGNGNGFLFPAIIKKEKILDIFLKNL